MYYLTIALVVLAEGLDRAGASTFIFPYPIHWPASGTVYHYLMVTNPLTTPLTVTISMPLMPAVEPSQTLTLGPAESRTLSVSSGAMANSYYVEDKGVLVTCDKDIVVQAISRFTSSNLNSAGAFFVLPTSALSTNYLVVTECSDSNCFVTIAATQPNVLTYVSVDLRFTGATWIRYGSRFYSNGDTFQTGLQQYQVMQLVCSGCDMSGTILEADYPITVVVGGDKTQVPGHNTRVDFIAGMLLPYTTTSSEYLIAKLRYSGGSYYDQIKVGVLQAGTTVQFSGHAVTATDDRQIVTFTKYSEDAEVLTADGPVVVIQTSTGQISSSSRSGDPALLVPRSKARWRTNYFFAVPVIYGFDGIELVLIVETWQDGCLTTDGGVAVDTTRMTGSGDGQPAVIRLDMVVGQTGYVRSTCGAFTGFIYGLADIRAFAMPIGGSVEVTEETTTSAITTEPATTVTTTEMETTVETPAVTTEPATTVTTTEMETTVETPAVTTEPATTVTTTETETTVETSAVTTEPATTVTTTEMETTVETPAVTTEPATTVTTTETETTVETSAVTTEPATTVTTTETKITFETTAEITSRAGTTVDATTKAEITAETTDSTSSQSIRDSTTNVPRPHPTPGTKRLCPCFSCEWFHNRPKNISAALQRGLEIRDNLLVDRKNQSLYRRTKQTEGEDKDVITTVSAGGLGFWFLIHLVWICCSDCAKMSRLLKDRRYRKNTGRKKNKAV